MKKIALILFTILYLGCENSNQELKYRSVEFYIEELKGLQVEEFVKQKLFKDSENISEEYLDVKTNFFNEKGLEKYTDIKVNIYKSYFRDYLYQQHITFENNVYVLYFSVSGFDDMEWHVVKWDEKKWENEEKLSRDKMENSEVITELFWNYDEGPKNSENVNIFVENNYLILERGKLYHSIYDLKSDIVLINEESPWAASGMKEKEQIDLWIKDNLHNKIQKQIKIKR